MSEIVELSRKSMFHSVDGITAVDAEIVVMDNEKKVFIHGQWVDEVSDQILFGSTKERFVMNCPPV